MGASLLETGSREPSSISVDLGPAGFDPARWLNTLATDLLDKMLHPQRGVTRGLLASDEPAKIIGIRVDELRQIGLCLRTLKREREKLAEQVETLSKGLAQ